MKGGLDAIKMVISPTLNLKGCFKKIIFYQVTAILGSCVLNDICRRPQTGTSVLNLGPTYQTNMKLLMLNKLINVETLLRMAGFGQS